MLYISLFLCCVVYCTSSVVCVVFGVLFIVCVVASSGCVLCFVFVVLCCVLCVISRRPMSVCCCPPFVFCYLVLCFVGVIRSCYVICQVRVVSFIFLWFGVIVYSSSISLFRIVAICLVWCVSCSFCVHLCVLVVRVCYVFSVSCVVGSCC